MSGPRGSGVSVWLDRVQLVVLAVTLSHFLRGKGSHATLLAITLALPIGRALASASYRRSWQARIARAWSCLERYSEGGGAVPWGAAWFLIGLPFVVLSLLNDSRTSSQDNTPTKLMAASLLLQGDLELSEYTEPPGDSGRVHYPDELPYCLIDTPSGVRSAYPEGTLVVAVPGFLLARFLGGAIEQAKSQNRLEKWIAALCSACCAVLVLLIAAQIVDARGAWATAALTAFGTALFSTAGQGLWSHDGALLFLLTGVWIEFRRADPSSLAARSPWLATLVQGLCLGTGFACRLTAAAVLLPFGLWQLARTPRRALAVGALAVLSFAPWAIYHREVYGTLLGPQQVMGEDGFALERIGTGLCAVLWSPGRGLLVYQPWFLLALLAPFAGSAPKTGLRAPRGWAAFAAAAVLLQLGLVATWVMWWGGHCWGSRLLTESVPLCALLAAPAVAWLASARAGRAILVGVGLLSFALHATYVYGSARRWMDDPPTDPAAIEARMWSWRDAPFLYPL